MINAQSNLPTCSLDGKALQQRVHAMAELNARALLDQRRSGRALILTYAPAVADEVRALIAREKDCCGFLDFQDQEDDARVVLTITVPADREAEADSLLAPFDGTMTSDAISCCGECR